MRFTIATLALTTLAFADFSNELEAPLDSDDYRVSEVIVLGAPRDYRNNDFQLMSTCAPSGATQHTMAQMTVEFDDSCDTVAAEVQARASSQDGWTDPHNEGNYSVLSADANNIKIKRRTGNNKYTDVITFALAAKGTGCTANVCSVSQGNSNNDAGTNLCNMENLFCNEMTKNYENGVGCKSLTNDLSYTTSYQECGRYRGNGSYREHDCQNFVDTCLKDQPLSAQAVVLAKPPERRNNDFELMSTCAPSGARQHTMAQMTVSFTDSCHDVTNEVMGRAQGVNGWTDPHNEGTYKMLATNNGYIKMKRRTGNNKYTDVITFDMQADGAGCKANICSVSQGNSNNDAGTNMCNMQNLFCNSDTKNEDDGVACKTTTKDLTYNVDYLECGRYTNGNQYREHDCQDFASTCLKNPSEGAFKILRNLFN